MDPKVVRSGLDDPADLLRLLLDSTAEGIFCIDPEGKCLVANAACGRLLGFEPSDEALSRQMEALAQEAWLTRRSSHAPDAELSRSDGSAIHLDVWSHPVERDGELLGCLIIFLDTTREASVHMDLAAALEAADAATSAKGQFLANMSHELRTPMNAILGYSEMLIEEAADKGSQHMVEDLERINSAGKHLLSLIDDVLDLSKIESGSMDFTLEEFDVAELVESVAAVVEPLLSAKSSRLVVEVPAGLGSMTADRAKVRQALFNLASNAAKFTADGTVSITVTRETGADGDHLLLAVTDTGIGIREAKLAEIFEDFTQGDSSSTRAFGGTGLGLPLSRQLCQMMGGDVTVESEVDIGSTFTIDLPAHVTISDTPMAALDLAANIYVLARPVNSDELLSLAAAHRPADGRDVLIVEDDDYTRSLMRRSMDGAGWVSHEARTGIEGLEMLRKMPPHLIVLELTMPVMDGFEFVAAARRVPGAQDTPVILITPDEPSLHELDRLQRSITKLAAESGVPTDEFKDKAMSLLSTGRDGLSQ
jgi:PAS domain S-box-containing protein